jgi:Uma2 family endonuclease
MTTAPALDARLTPEDLLERDDLGRYEALIDGELKERHVSVESSHVATKFTRRMGYFAEDQEQLGWVFGSDCGLQCFPWAPNKVRFSDGGFYSAQRGGPPGRGHLRFAPNLVLEVVSPGDTAEELDDKIDDYLRAGVSLIWVAMPARRHVQVVRPGGNWSRLTADDMLTGEEVLPGFSVRVGDLFLPVVEAGTPA